MNGSSKISEASRRGRHMLVGSAITSALRDHLIVRIGRRGLIETVPTALAIRAAAGCCIDRVVTSQNRFCLSFQLIWYTSAEQCTATPHTFSIDMRVFVGVASILQCTNDAASCSAAERANASARRSRGKPARRGVGLPTEPPFGSDAEAGLDVS
jgi:hypothetical protein